MSEGGHPALLIADQGWDRVGTIALVVVVLLAVWMVFQILRGVRLRQINRRRG